MDLFSVIKKPLYSEKSYFVKSLEPKTYVFEVDLNANKTEIATAFFLIFNVKPLKVNVLNRKAVPTRTGTRTPGYTKAVKIAYITLPVGSEIVLEQEEKPEKDKKAKDKDKVEAKVEEKAEEKAKKPKKGILSRIIKTGSKAK